VCVCVCVCVNADVLDLSGGPRQRRLTCSRSEAETVSGRREREHSVCV